jgi:6-phosphogluconolactonase (cycloisomerase 2 family)
MVGTRDFGKQLAVVLGALGMFVLAGSAQATTSFPERPGTLPSPSGADIGAVYVLTNQPVNSVMVYARAADGRLTFARTYKTRGAGAGSGADPLGSQNSLVLGRHGQLLFAVNAGSNDVSVFEVRGLELRLLDRVPSHGQMPVSVAVRGDVVYVLNAGGTPNVSGFFMFAGRLKYIPGSTRPLAGGTNSAPGEVAFSPDGNVLMVTEKGTNLIDTWRVDAYGHATHHHTTDSHGAVPFGFTFTRGDDAIVAEAAPSALSSYEVDDDGHLGLLTGTLADGGMANCWVVVTHGYRGQRFAFAANAGSGTISSYSIAADGTLDINRFVAATTGGAPVDEALSRHDRFLYVRDAQNGTIDGFRIANDGTLTPAGSTPGVPAGAQGIAAR